MVNKKSPIQRTNQQYNDLQDEDRSEAAILDDLVSCIALGERSLDCSLPVVP